MHDSVMCVHEGRANVPRPNLRWPIFLGEIETHTRGCSNIEAFAPDRPGDYHATRCGARFASPETASTDLGEDAIVRAPMTSESGADEPSTPCRACGGPLQVAFDVEVLGDTKATYHQCARCRSLMALNPSWLDRSYATTLYPDPDTGALRRTLYVNRFIRRM